MSRNGCAVPIIAFAVDGSDTMHFVDMKSCADAFKRKIRVLYSGLCKGCKITNNANGKQYFLDYELQYGIDYF